MEELYVIITENDVIRLPGQYMIPVVQADGQTSDRPASELLVGETIVVPRDLSNVNEKIVAIAKGGDGIIADLANRISVLEDTLQATNDALLNVQKNIVSLTAEHVQNLFQNEVLLDSIAHRILAAGANAIAHKAQSAKNRAPELVVIENVIPGAIRVTLTDDGVQIEEQNSEGEFVGGEQVSEELRRPEVAAVFGDLVVAYGGELNRAYYVVESTHLEEFRKQASQKAMELTRAVDAAGEE